MEDNDIRGFLDGNFMWGWNQPGQVHVRIGRRGGNPKFGEFELFRVLQRWDPIVLPDFAEIKSARISLKVEQGADFPLRVMLFEVKKDWNPGEGGVLKNNVSPPLKGEVWWNDIGYQEKSWGLPGVSFASDDDPQADTGAFPLAEASYSPESVTLEFASTQLTEYISEQVKRQQPLLFLLKVSDYQEDLPGTGITISSASHGDSRNLIRRPHLTLEWEGFSEEQSLTKKLFIEYGRQYTTPSIGLKDSQAIAISFKSDLGYLNPTIEIQGGNKTKVYPWVKWPAPIDPNWDWFKVRVMAVYDYIVLGQSFTAELSDTWVRTQPPEEQNVTWVFISPSGKKNQLNAEYLDNNKWEIVFPPDELGPWQYYWTQNFTTTPYKSELGQFDVIGGTELNIRLQVEVLLNKIGRNKETRRSFIAQFMRLERAAMQLQTPSSFHSESGSNLRNQLNQIRSVLGKPVPEQMPLRPSPPPNWQSK